MDFWTQDSRGFLHFLWRYSLNTRPIYFLRCMALFIVFRVMSIDPKSLLQISYNKPTKCTNFSNLFLEWNSTCFGEYLCPSSGVFTVHTATVFVIQVCEQDVPSWSCSQAVGKLVWHIPLLCLQWKTPDDGQRNCPKHVVFHFKNKFKKLVHLGGFIIRNLTRCTVTWTSKSCKRWSLFTSPQNQVNKNVADAMSGVVLRSEAVSGGIPKTLFPIV
jgi:hypothetical protein